MCERKKNKNTRIPCPEKAINSMQLATEFNVSTDTIDRDIVYLSGIAPVYTKQGNQGGVYILPEYRSYKNYLTDEEEECLYSLIKKSANDERRIICGIITKFTKNTVMYK